MVTFTSVDPHDQGKRVLEEDEEGARAPGPIGRRRIGDKGKDRGEHGEDREEDEGERWMEGGGGGCGGTGGDHTVRLAN